MNQPFQVQSRRFLRHPSAPAYLGLFLTMIIWAVVPVFGGHDPGCFLPKRVGRDLLGPPAAGNIVTMYLIPLLSVAAGMIFLNEPLSLMKALGIATVMAGRYLANVRWR